MRAVLVVLILQCAGCAFYGGFAVHNTGRGQPEYNADNPIGIVGGQKRYDEFMLYCEHHSMLARRDTGLGYNLCGVKYFIKED